MTDSTEHLPVRPQRRGYGFLTTAAVRYLPVTKNGAVIGYLWASVTGDAAHFVARVDAGTDGSLAEYPWFTRLEEAERHGLSAMDALRRWVGAPEDPRAGGIDADTPMEAAPSLAVLHEIAQS